MANKKGRVYTNHTLEEFNKKYENKKYKVVDKVDADKSPELLDDRSWWLIDEKYYEVPKKKIGTAGIVALSVLCAGAVAAAIVVPIALLSQPSSPSIKVEVNGNATESHTYVNGDLVITLRATGKNKTVTGIEKVLCGNAILKSTEYTFNVTSQKVTITKAILDKNPGDVSITPVIGDVEPEVVHVESIELTYISINIFVDEEDTIPYEILPKNATDKTVKWSSDNPDTVFVDENTGLVKGVSVGDATVTVTTNDGGKTSSCYVNVSAKTEPFQVNGEHNVDADNPASEYTATVVGSGESVDVTWSLKGLPVGYDAYVSINEKGTLNVSKDLDKPISATIVATSQEDPSASVEFPIEIASFLKVACIKEWSTYVVRSAQYPSGEKAATGKILIPSRCYDGESSSFLPVYSFAKDEQERGAFEGCIDVSLIALPDIQIQVTNSAFKGIVAPKEQFTYIYIPENISYITGDAFAYTDDIMFKIDPANKSFVTFDSGETLAGCDEKGNVTKLIHLFNDDGLAYDFSKEEYEAVTEIDCYAAAGNVNPGIKAWPKNLEIIEHHAFAGCSVFSEVTFTSSIKKIGLCAFAECDQLENITFPLLSDWSVSNHGYDVVLSQFVPMMNSYNQKLAYEYIKCLPDSEGRKTEYAMTLNAAISPFALLYDDSIKGFKSQGPVNFGVSLTTRYKFFNKIDAEHTTVPSKFYMYASGVHQEIWNCSIDVYCDEELAKHDYDENGGVIVNVPEGTKSIELVLYSVTKEAKDVIISSVLVK